MAALGTGVLGYRQRLYLGVTMSSSGFSGGNLINNAMDVKVKNDAADLDFTLRNCNGFKGHAVGLKDLELTFKLPYDDGDTNGLIALLSAKAANTSIKVAAVDGNDKNGEVAECRVFDASRNEQNGEIVSFDFTLKPYYAAAIPPVVIGNT